MAESETANIFRRQMAELDRRIEDLKKRYIENDYECTDLRRRLTAKKPTLPR